MDKKHVDAGPMKRMDKRNLLSSLSVPRGEWRREQRDETATEMSRGIDHPQLDYRNRST